MAHEKGEKTNKPNHQIAQQLETIGKQRPVNPLIVWANKNLHKSEKAPQGEYKASLQAARPIAETTRLGGNITESLTHVIVVGDTVLGVSRTVNNKPGADKRVEEYRLSVLPVGAKYDQPQLSDSPVTLLSARPKVMDNLRDDPQEPYYQRFERFRIGGQSIMNLTGVRDEYISSKHADLIISSDGTDHILSVHDFASTNGTQVFTAEDFEEAESTGALAGFAQYLQSDPVSWSAEFADQKMINPY